MVLDLGNQQGYYLNLVKKKKAGHGRLSTTERVWVGILKDDDDYEIAWNKQK